MNLEAKFSTKSWPTHPEKVTAEGKNKFIGFWMFLAGETVLFGCLFATYLALRNRGADPAMAKTQDMFELSTVFIATILLLTSSLTSAFAIYYMKNFNFKMMQFWLGVTVLLGLTFLILEISEFHHYVTEFHHTMTSSAFGSSFYLLVGTHGGHVLFGLCWITTLMIRNAKRGLNLYNAPKFYVATLYWHFIDVVWVFIFTVVYLMGMVG